MSFIPANIQALEQQLQEFQQNYSSIVTAQTCPSVGSIVKDGIVRTRETEPLPGYLQPVSRCGRACPGISKLCCGRRCGNNTDAYPPRRHALQHNAGTPPYPDNNARATAHYDGWTGTIWRGCIVRPGTIMLSRRSTRDGPVAIQGMRRSTPGRRTSTITPRSC